MRTVKSSSQNFFQSLILKIGHLRLKSRHKPPGNTPLPAINRSHENTEILGNLNIAIQISIKKKGIAISQNFDFSIALQQNTYTLPRCNIWPQATQNMQWTAAISTHRDSFALKEVDVKLEFRLLKEEGALSNGNCFRWNTLKCIPAGPKVLSVCSQDKRCGL